MLGGGGYVAGPVALAAQAQRIPLALMEADAHLGLANRLAAPFAERVFLSFPVAGRDGEKYRVVGRPIPGALPPGAARGGPCALRAPGGRAGRGRLRREPGARAR